MIGPDGKKLDRKYVSIDKDQFHLMTFHSSPSEAKLSPSEKTSFYVDPSKTPSHIDLVIMEGDNLGRTKLGIYAFEGEQLKVCIGNLDAPRPTAFAPGDNQVNLLLERKSK